VVECSGAVKWWDCDNVEVCEDTCTASAMVEIPGTPEELLMVENEECLRIFFRFLCLSKSIEGRALCVGVLE